MSMAHDPSKPPVDTTGEGGEISAEELAERIERLQAMGRTIGNDFAMKVVVGKKRGWRYIFKPVNTIEVDPEDVKTKGLEYCFGLIAHEGAHRRVSRVDFIPKEIWQAPGFSFLMNAVEDPRVNNWVSTKYGGVRNWLEQVYTEDMPDEDRIDAKAKEKMGYTPKHIRYGLEVIRYWHKGVFSKDVPSEVREVLERTIVEAERAYTSLPSSDPEEEEIVEQARSAYEIVYSGIWPEYQKLVEQAQDDEAVRQLIKDMLERGELDLPPEAMSSGESDGERQKEEGGEGESGDNNDEEDKEEREVDKEKSKKKTEPLPLGQMPEEMREGIKQKIREKLDGMSEEEREKVLAGAEERAKKILDELETELGNKLRGKFSDQPETRSEERERIEREKTEAEEARKRAEEIRKAKEALEKKAEAEKNDYERAYEEVKPYIDKVAEDLMNIFIPKRFPQTRPGFPGQKMHLKGAMAYESQGEYRKLFEARLPSERPDYSFLLLVDLSGSMQGQKIDETFKATVLFVEALSRVSETLGTVKVAVYGFQDELILYKEFGSALDDAKRLKMSDMKKEVGNKGTHNRSSYNNDGFCVDAASGILRQQQSPNQFLVVLSDGMPEGDFKHRVERYNGLSQDEELERVVADISAAGDQYVLGIGLGSGTEHVSRFYRSDLPNISNIPNVRLRELVEVLAGKIEEMIKK